MKKISLTASAGLALVLGMLASSAYANGLLEKRLAEKVLSGTDQKIRVPVVEGCVDSMCTKTLRYGSAPRQNLDIYTPQSGATKKPLIVMVHGGGWHQGDKAMVYTLKNKRDYYVAKGYAFASVNYRMIPEATPDVQAQDVQAAVAHILGRTTEFGVDPTRVYLMGHSAGGHLVALVNAQSARPMWRGVIGLDSGAYDIPQTMNSVMGKIGIYQNAFGVNKGYWPTVSPVDLHNKGSSPILMICSTTWRQSCIQSEDYANKIQTMGGKAQVLKTDLDHGQVNHQVGVRGGDLTVKIDAFIASLE